ncbi:MAG: hypothetical protein D4R73_05005, partial [Deltaproteobacteria bacterium]
FGLAPQRGACRHEEKNSGTEKASLNQNIGNHHGLSSGGTSAEIDFIVDKSQAYEVKVSPQESDVKRLRSMAMDLKLEGFKVVSKNYSDLENVIYGFML